MLCSAVAFITKKWWLSSKWALLLPVVFCTTGSHTAPSCRKISSNPKCPLVNHYHDHHLSIRGFQHVSRHAEHQAWSTSVGFIFWGSTFRTSSPMMSSLLVQDWQPLTFGVTLGSDCTRLLSQTFLPPGAAWALMSWHTAGGLVKVHKTTLWVSLSVHDSSGPYLLGFFEILIDSDLTYYLPTFRFHFFDVHDKAL